MAGARLESAMTAGSLGAGVGFFFDMSKETFTQPVRSSRAVRARASFMRQSLEAFRPNAKARRRASGSGPAFLAKLFALLLQHAPTLFVLRQLLGIHHLELDAAVERHARLRLVGRHRALLAVADRRVVVRRELRVVGQEPIAHRVRATLRQALVVGVRAAPVTVSADLDPQLRPLDEDLAQLVQDGFVFRKDVPL